MMQLNTEYQRDDFLKYIEENLLTDFKKDVRPVNISGLSSIQKANYLGESKSLDLQVFEFLFEGSPNKRVALTKDAFSVMRSSAIFQALAVFHSPDNKDWRFSLMTANPEPTEKGKASISYSNPKRLSFFLGPNAKINTPTKFLISKGNVIDFEDLKNRFSIEVVNKEFYKEISQAFTQLVNNFLQLPLQNRSQTSLEFAVRLIGRIIFCWFLREKKSQAGIALMPKELLSLDAVKKNDDYYHKILEPIFFEVLNKPAKYRKDDFTKDPFSSVPYLNGGLFSPQDDDYYKRTNEDYQSQFHNTLVIPDNWIKDFFEILETYNFTIDENTSYDEELSIDPEMLGRIFENLLAEINPETGESARKSTGSYYTPRTIVNYMVDESLLLYLKEQTGIEEEKLRAIISYDLSDDVENPVTIDEKEKIINALEKIKILDPACGSGAFPIGALQKIVFILQQTDPDGQLWFKKQIKNTSPEIKRIVEREFAHKNFDYLRKLGIIRENIYGIDIQPIATEISRLRCFLTLVVDERIQEDLENRGIEPLPNLDFKFVTANTLIGLPGSQSTNQIGLYEDNAGIGELKDLRDLFFNASGTEREQLKLRFVQAQNRMFQRLISEGRVGHADLTTKLTTWDPFSHKSSSWFDSEWMFGIKEGFDIVIANPPYVGQKGHKNLFELYQQSNEWKIYYERKQDIYYYFIIKGLCLLNSSGFLAYIIPPYFLTAEAGKKLRKFIVAESSIYKILNLSETVKVFDTVSINNLILFLAKDDRFKKIKIIIEEPIDKIDNNFIHHLKKYESKFSTKELTEKEWYILKSSNTFEINSNNTLPLGYLAKITPGIQTGCDKVSLSHINKYKIGSFVKQGEGIFVLTETEKENLHLNKTELNFIKPFYKNSEIFKWGYISSNKKWLLITNEIENLDEYPNIKKHLIKYKKILDERYRNFALMDADKSGKWWFLYGYRPDTNFEGTKIVFPYRSLKNTFALSKHPFYSVMDIFYISILNENFHINYILALLNSTLMYYYLLNNCKKKGKILELIQKPLSNIPIKNIAKNDQLNFINLVNKIYDIIFSIDYLQDLEKQKLVKEYEKQIDQMVYQLYGLSSEEIATVEGKNEIN